MKNGNKTPHLSELDQKGQSFLEFLLMMFMVMGFANLLLIGINGAVGKRWKVMIQKIAAPTDTTIKFR
jgi:hypothetical protein